MKSLLALVFTVLALAFAATGAAAVSDPGGGGGYNVPPAEYCTDGWDGWYLNWGGWDFFCYNPSYTHQGTFCYVTCGIYRPTHYGWHRH